MAYHDDKRCVGGDLPTPDRPDWTHETPRPPAGESPSVATTFEITLEDLNVAGEDVPGRVAGDLVALDDPFLRIRCPTTTFVLDGTEVRQEPIPAERAWKKGRVVDDAPAWIDAVVRHLGLEGQF